MSESKQINFTIVPDDGPAQQPLTVTDAGGRTVRLTVATERTYANFCAVANTPFDCTLTFCEVLPLSEQEIRAAQNASEHIVRAPVRARVVIPLQTLPALVAALQEQMRAMPQMPAPGPVH
jgi:hypothetical protein